MQFFYSQICMTPKRGEMPNRGMSVNAEAPPTCQTLGLEGATNQKGGSYGLFQTAYTIKGHMKVI